MTARVIEFRPAPRQPRDDGERFEASVADDGSIRIVIGNGEGERTWTLTPRQAVELAAFFNNDVMARLR